MNRIYCISGLGADQRVFKKLSIAGYELAPVNWIPFSKTDTLPAYAQKLAAQIKDENPIIIGLSFGGMLTVEIAKQIQVKKAFIVSSAKTSAELGIPGGGIVRWLINSGTIPSQLLTIPNPIALSYLGAKTADDRQLLSAIIRDADGAFMKWALRSITHWQNDSYTQNVIHIHGTADKVIDSAKVHPHFWIDGGTHIMIYNRAAEVSKIISDCLSS